MKNEQTQYVSFIKEIKELIYRRQYEAMKKVNVELLLLYWEIGKEIDTQQKEKGWGKSVINVLADELQKEFPGVKGYSARNLRRMKIFYVEYTQNTILPPMGAELGNTIWPPLVAKLENTILPPMVAELENTTLPPLLEEISWANNVVIIEKCKDINQRIFYITMTKKYGWTKNVLINHIENHTFEKYLTNQTNFDETVPEKYRLQAKLAVKDEYNFDFLEMGGEYSEAELELTIIKNIRAFLMELGGDFSFIGNQYHLDVADDDYYIDLLLYHRRLKCLIAIELKTGEFIPEYAGKMQFYLSALDENVKLPDENNSIGIIICKNKNRTRVEYTLKSTNKPIGVASYSYKDLPKDMINYLPSPDEISAIVTNMMIKSIE